MREVPMPGTSTSRTTHARGAGAWQARYDRAWGLLNDTAGMLDLEAVAAGVDPQGPPAARTIAGETHLRSARHIGLLAGSFNPLTLAHLAMAASARDAADLDALVWTMAVVTIDKERVERATLPDRLAQLAALIAGAPHNAVALVNRGLYVEQVRALQTRVAADADVAVVVGFDKVVQIFDARYYDDRDAALADLFGEARLLVAPRGDAGEREVEELLRRPENVAFADRVTMLPLAAEHRQDSSTEARRLAGERGPQAPELRSLLPPEGCALAATGAYTLPGGHEDDDTYHWRQLWLRALASDGWEERTNLPPLSALVALATDRGKTGAEIRRLLTHAEEPQARSALREAVRSAAPRDGTQGST